MQPASKSPAIRRLQSMIVGTDVLSSIEQDRCVSCKGPATEFKTELARKEFSQSGLCQTCQDEEFTPSEEEQEFEYEGDEEDDLDDEEDD